MMIVSLTTLWFPLQKELGQKDRHLQQHQTKLDEMLRQLSEASYQQVWSQVGCWYPKSWYFPSVAHFVLVLLFLLQVDLEWELEHKEALLAHCMKREAEEVWEAEALVDTSDCWTSICIQHSLAACLQKSYPSQRGQAQYSLIDCALSKAGLLPQSIHLTTALSSELSGIASSVKIIREQWGEHRIKWNPGFYLQL